MAPYAKITENLLAKQITDSPSSTFAVPPDSPPLNPPPSPVISSKLSDMSLEDQIDDIASQMAKQLAHNVSKLEENKAES
jgi:hypothetical protein